MIQFLPTAEEMAWCPLQIDELELPYFEMSNYHYILINVQQSQLSSYNFSRMENRSNKTEQSPESNPKGKHKIKISNPKLNYNFLNSASCSTHTFEQIRQLVLLAMDYSSQSQIILQSQIKIVVGDDQVLKAIFDVLLRRFKKLQKTKEQMIKHCMRKTFKWIAEKNDVSIKKTSETRIFFQNYFGGENVQSKGIEIPLRKQTQMKTMNKKFLLSVFKNSKFLSDYKQHLSEFQNIAQKSNQRKIQFLVITILEFINKGTLKKLQTFKRLPWTTQILNKIIAISHEIMETSVSKNTQPEEKIKRKKGRPKKYQYRCPQLYQIKNIDLNSSCTTTMFKDLI